MTDEQAERVLGALAALPYAWVRPGMRLRWRHPRNPWPVNGVVLQRGDYGFMVSWENQALDYYPLDYDGSDGEILELDDPESGGG